MMDQQSQADLAIDLLNKQLVELGVVQQLDYKDPKFVTWRDTTTNLLQRFLRPDSSHFITFRDLRYRSSGQVRRLPYNYRGPVPVDPAARPAFQRACEIAEGAIRGAIDEIRIFGIHSEIVRRDTPRGKGGFQQTFHGPVTFHNQAVATDNAIQNIGQMGEFGASLKEISELLPQSMELKGREMLEGLKATQEIASEVGKPEPQRNWKSMLESGNKLLDIAGRATDLATKLAPHMPAIAAMIHEATKRL